MFADADKYVDRAKSDDVVKIKRCWKRISDESRNAPGPAKAARQLGRIQALARQMQDDQPEKARCFETLSKLIEDKALAKGVDWCSWVGPKELGVVMLYGHDKCKWKQTFVEPKNLEAMMAWAAKELHFHGSPPELEERLKGSGIYPLSSCDFWRLRAPLHSSSDIVDFDSADTGAHWHCCGCVDRWSWGAQGSARLMVFGQSKLGEIQLDEEGRAFCIFVGNIRQEQENRFQLMKASVLASELDEDGGEISKDSILAVIRKLNDLCQTRFGKDARVVSLRSADTEKHEKWAWHVPVCQNTALSMEAVGQSVKVFVIDKDETPILHQKQIDFLQGVIAHYMDLDEWKPGNTQGTRRMVRKLMDLRDEAGRVQKSLEDGVVP